MTSFAYWILGRLCEVTTWVGMALVYLAGLGLSSTNETLQIGLTAFNQFAPPVGMFLISMSERRHRDAWKAEGKTPLDVLVEPLK